MRLFVAADLPGAVRDRLGGAQRALRGLPFRVRWTRPEGIHLTFAFLGEVAPSRVDALGAALGGAVLGGIAPYALAARGVGVFPDRGRPRVVWAGVTGDLDAAARTKRAIDEALAPIGFAPEERPFRPHLTLGRVAEGGGGGGDWRVILEQHQDDDFGVFDVPECVLFESHLGPGGARYRALMRFALGGGGAA